MFPTIVKLSKIANISVKPSPTSIVDFPKIFSSLPISENILQIHSNHMQSGIRKNGIGNLYINV